MLTYNHLFNENLEYPFHIHVIESNTTSVDISLNNVHVGYYKPTYGTKYILNKYYNIADILNLMVVGSRQVYNKQKEKAYFKPSTIRYIRNPSGKFLVLDLETNKYYWSETSRTSFFFNPEYFSSKVVWENTIGYIPIGTTTADLWDEDTAKDLFLTQIYETTQDWSGQITIADIEPITIDYFGNDISGEVKTLQVDTFIEELQDLKDGDILRIDNGLETLEVTVENIYTKAVYNTINETVRPLIHVPIDIINPNKKYLYSKPIVIGQEEDVILELESNIIQFSIKSTLEGTIENLLSPIDLAPLFQDREVIYDV